MSDFVINDNETIEDLQYRGYKIIQRKDGFKFGVDAVLAAYFSETHIKPGHKVLDLGTGTGIISILAAARTDAVEITGIEIQEDIAYMARRSVKLNNLESRISIITDNIASPSNIKFNYYDHVITNPPYKKAGTGIVNPSGSRAISRHEILCTLEDVISLSSRSLKQYGMFTMINRPDRLCDTMVLMRKYKIEPKLMRFVHPYHDKAPNLMLIQGVKEGSAFLKIEPPLYIFDKDGAYTKELDEIYNRG